MKRRRKSTSGFTLTEIAIVLGVMGSVLAAIWVASSIVTLNSRTEKANAEILTIYAGYKSIYATRAMDNTGDMTCMGAQGNVFPSEMIKKTCVPGDTTTFPVSPWNTPVQVNGVQASNQFDIMVYNLTKQACINLASPFYNSPQVTTEYIGPYGAWTVFNGTATPAQITATCANVTNNFVLFRFAAQ